MQPVTLSLDQTPRNNGWKLLGNIAPFIVLLVFALKFFGELGRFVGGAAMCAPFAGLAILAYLGLERRWARVLTVALLVPGLLYLGILASVVPLLPFLDQLQA